MSTNPHRQELIDDARLRLTRWLVTMEERGGDVQGYRERWGVQADELFELDERVKHRLERNLDDELYRARGYRR